jgi:hypothetical protein
MGRNLVEGGIEKKEWEVVWMGPMQVNVHSFILTY